MGCHSLLQGIFLAPGLNLCLLYWQADSLPLSHQGSPINRQLSCLVVMSRTLSPGGSISVALRTLLRGDRRGSQAAYNKGDWQSELSHKESACNAGASGDAGSVPGLGISPGGVMATHSSILAWRVPWTEEHARLQSKGSQRAGHQVN